jgi:predicted acyl esterase
MVALAVAAVLSPLSGARAAIDPARVQWAEAYFPSADKTLLHAYVFRPAGMGPTDRVPVIVTMGPYFGSGGASVTDPMVGLVPLPTNEHAGPVINSHGLMTVGDIVGHGYAFVEVDSRGFGASGGCTDLLGRDDAADVKTAVEWAAGQPWSTGRVGMWGLSYEGATQVLALAEKPHGLAAAVIASPLTDVYRALYMNGNRYFPLSGYIPAPYYDRLSLLPPGIYSDPQQFTNHYSGLTPKCYSANVVGGLKSDHSSAFWQERDYRARAGGSTVPVLWSHGFEDEAVHSDNFLDVWKTLRGPHRAWFGQFSHEPAQMSELGHPDELGRSGFLAEAIRWYDQYLKGLRASGSADPTVEIQEGNGAWRAERSWPPADQRAMRVAINPGQYRDRAGNAAESNFSLPGEFTPIKAPAEPTGVGAWTFSRALPFDAHIAGVPRVNVTVSGVRNGVAVNVIALLYDVSPDGTATLMDRGAYVASRSGDIAFDMYPQDWRLRAGHRVGLLLTGADDSWFTPGVSGTKVIVGGGSLNLPVLSCQRTQFLSGGPSAVVRGRQPITVGQDVIASATASTTLPPWSTGHPCRSR